MQYEQPPADMLAKMYDPAFRAKLAADPVKYGKEIGIDTGIAGINFVVKQNTVDTFYMPVHRVDDSDLSVSQDELFKISAAGTTGTIGSVSCAGSLGSVCGTASTASTMASVATLGSN